MPGRLTRIMRGVSERTAITLESKPKRTAGVSSNSVVAAARAG
jgi:hypothetical protein